jgi:hypothetical protein
MNGCPRTYSVIGVSTAGGCNAVAERQYDSQPTNRYAAVSESVNVPGGAYYTTLTEGYDFCVMRTDASQGLFACGPDSIMTTWLGCVLRWGHYGCPGDDLTVGKPAALPPLATLLRQAFPNPMNPTAKITYTVGKSGRVWLRVFDVSGHVVRTLVDQYREARREAYEAIWDGMNDRGERASSGVFFYQLEASGYKSAKKIVILR